MRFKWLGSFKFQFFMTVFTVMSLLFGGVIFNTDRLLKTLTLSNTEAAIAQTSEMLNLLIVENTESGELDELEIYLTELMSSESKAVVYLALLDENGHKIIATPSLPNPLPPIIPFQQQLRMQENIIHIEQPVLFADNKIARLRFGYSTLMNNQAREKIFTHNFLFFLVGVLSAMAALLILGMKAAIQFRQLIFASQSMAGGDYAVRAKDQGNNELSELAKNFNEMALAVAAQTNALRDSEGKLSAMFAGVQDGIIIVDIETKRLLDVNSAICEMLDYSKDEMLAMILEDIVPPQHLVGVLRKFELAVRGDIKLIKEAPILGRQGDYLPVDIAISLFNNQGRRLLAGFFRDVTERKQAEQELHEHRLNLEKMVADRTASLERSEAIAHVGGWHLNLQNDFLSWSDETYRIFETPIGASISVPLFFSYIHPDDVDKVSQAWEAALNGAEYNIEHRIIVGNSVKWVRERAEFEFNRQGQATVAHGAVLDITELKAGQRELEVIIDNLPTVFFTKDRQGRHLMVNRRYEEAVGVTKQAALGRTDFEIFSAEGAESIVDVDREVLNSGKALTFEEQVPHPDGTAHHYLTTKVPLLDAKGDAYALIGLATDINEQKKLQAQLMAAKNEAERLMKVKSEFLANMSHEIRTPLNAILGLAKIGERDSQEEAIGELFKQVLNSGQHLLGLLNDILDFSKLEAGKLVAEKHQFQLADMVENVIRLMMDQAKVKELSLNFAIQQNVPQWVQGDSLRLKQILLNLLSNAVKFTHRGEVSLHVSALAPNIIFDVKDTGIGMTEQQMAHLFSPFEQGDSSTTRRFGGSGLGLAISQNLAELMGGKITVRSELDKGSVFSLALPLTATSAEIAVEPQPEIPPEVGNRLQGKRILVAEDVEINRFIIEDILIQEQAEVVFAENGLQAVEQVEQQTANSFDIVLMDVQMPVMDGYQAARKIKQLAPQLPIISLTAHAMQEERERCLAAGMLDHVTKPVESEVLITAILKYML